MKTFLTSVNASSASGPSSRPSPERLNPPNGVEYRTDAFEFTDRLPLSTPRATRSARPRSRVQIDPDRPYSVSLASATASASSSNGSTATTGPNTSSRQTGSTVERGSTTVGGYQNPGPAGALPRNATSTGAPPASAPPSTKPRTLSRWPALISGPMSTSGLAGDPTRSPVTAGSSSSRNRSYTVRSTRIRERAQQSWPALSNTPAGAFAAARSTSASAKTMFADLPPSSRVTRLTWSAACRRMCVPTSVDPVNTILRTCSWVTSRSPTTEPLPGSTVNTPGGQARLPPQLGQTQRRQRCELRPA